MKRGWRPRLLAVRCRGSRRPIDDLVRDPNRATRSASARSDLLPTCLEVEAQADELDRSVGSELADDGEARDEEPSGDEDPVVGPARDQLGHGVELQGELVDHAKPFVDLEVVGGRFAVRTRSGGS